ncbi:Transmembrane protein 64 [Bienertia sinuspersici]
MPQKPSNAVSNTKPINMEVINSDYQRLDHNSALIDEESTPELANFVDNKPNNYLNQRWFNWRSKWLIIVLGSVIAISVIILIKRLAPSFVHKEIIPIIRWLIETFSPPVLACILFAAIALFPLLLLPTVPVKWIVGITFSYEVGFLLVMAGVAVAVSLPYFIAYYLFLDKLELYVPQKWLDNHPEKATIVRLAGNGDWLHQFQAIALLRLSPFPYVVFNYIAVVTGVKYGPYLAGTLIGMVPEILLAIYSGKLLRTMVEAMDEHTHVSKSQMIFDGVGFCLSAVSTIAIGFYAKWKLQQRQEVEEQQQLW